MPDDDGDDDDDDDEDDGDFDYDDGDDDDNDDALLTWGSMPGDDDCFYDDEEMRMKITMIMMRILIMMVRRTIMIWDVGWYSLECQIET